MIAIIIPIISILFIFSDSPITVGSVPQNVPKNTTDDSEFPFGITDIPSATMGWLYNQMYNPFQSEQESNSFNLGSQTNSHNSNTEKTPAKFVVDLDESADELKSPKKVDDILKIINNSSNEEKKKYGSFLENLEDAITNNPARYVKVFLKHAWHVVDLGIFKSAERRRNVENVKTTSEIVRDLIYDVIISVFNFVIGRVEDGKKGAQKVWAIIERAQEGDNREWKEEQALKRLNELENQFKDMDKETVIKDLTSLCMQPLYKISTYEKMLNFLQILSENGFEKTKLEKDFHFVEYKLKFSKNYGIN